MDCQRKNSIESFKTGNVLGSYCLAAKNKRNTTAQQRNKIEMSFLKIEHVQPVFFMRLGMFIIMIANVIHNDSQEIVSKILPKIQQSITKIFKRWPKYPQMMTKYLI